MSLHTDHLHYAKQLLQKLHHFLAGRADSGAAYSRGDVDAVMGQMHQGLLERLVHGLASGKIPMATTAHTSSPRRQSTKAPQELRTVKQRTAANLEAMHLLASKSAGFTAQEQEVLARYSGWGGLSLRKVQQWPEDFPKPEARGLIHEYYTPQHVCDEVVRVLHPLLQRQLSGQALRVLEPSAGIGRFVQAIHDSGLTPQVQAIEYSEVSARLIAARFGNTQVFQGSFEEWIADHPSERFDLVLANPPYGVRGPSKAADRDRDYKRSDDGTGKKAYAYFLRRALDTLSKGGVGVFLIPAGFMHGRGKQLRMLRERVLRRHHLMGAFRLPSGLFPGAMLVTDLLFFRARGGTLPEVHASDQAILEGRYFDQHPEHILGEEKGKAGGDDDNQTKKPRWGYQVEGQFTGLPNLVERPIMGSEQLAADRAPGQSARKKQQSIRRKSGGVTKGMSQAAVEAVSMATRADKVLAGSYEGWSELVRDLQSWMARHGNPHQNDDLQKLSGQGHTEAERFLTLFTRRGSLSAAFDNRPKGEERFKGDVRNVHQVAEHIYKDLRGSMTVRDFAQRWDELAKTTHSRAGVRGALSALTKKGWALDPIEGGADYERWLLMPDKDYFTGYLWPRVDRLQKLPEGAHTMWVKDQEQRLLDTIGSEALDEIDHDPRHGWVPRELVGQWLVEKVAGSYGYGKVMPPQEIKLVAEKGGWTLEGVPYAELKEQDRALRVCLGWINFDRGLFRPPKTEEEDLDKKRHEQAEAWIESWSNWVASDPDRADLVVAAYNRHFRGYVPIEYDATLVPVTRWNGAMTPHWYQRRSINRLIDQRGGILALDVGLGKTLTGIYTLARARQEGWARRPVIVVPNSLILKWEKDILKVLPDYRICLIGVNKSADKAGTVSASTDTAADRGRKWTEFQAGAYDVALVTFSMVGTTKVNEKTLRAYADQTIEFEFEARAEKLDAEKAKDKVDKGKRGAKPLTERQKAILAEGTLGWLAEIIEISAGRQYDEGVAWDDLGVDFLMVDEGQNFKNLFMAKGRDGGGPPKFMGGGQSSARAWHLHLRAWSVRRRTGGAGVILLSATPAKNSPLEFYSLTHFTNPEMWRKMGIYHGEQFVERYVDLATKEIVTPSGEFKTQAYARGFKNLHELRGAIERECEFRTADEVKLPIPEADVKLEIVPLSGDAEYKYEKYRKDYAEAANDPEGRSKLLSLLTRMSMVSVHPDLDEMQEGGSARRSPAKVYKAAQSYKSGFESDKLRACALNVVQRRDCAHVIFVEYVAAHAWLKKTLTKYGIEPERIATLNAVTAPKPSQRQAIAEAFNGNKEEGIAPLYDVVICNAVAYEGVDLQKRTCALHHIDLPYEPATLQQRNGRGVRQGNKYKNAQGRSVVTVYYYLAQDSIDIWRQQIIAGKRAWLVDLVKGQDRNTNNPADATADEDELLIRMSDDPEKARKRLAQLRRIAQARQRVDEAKVAVKKFRSAALALRAAQLREGKARQAQLDQARRAFSTLEKMGDVWPYMHLHDLVKKGVPAWATAHTTKPTEEQLKLQKAGIPFVPEYSLSFVMEGITYESKDEGGAALWLGRVEEGGGGAWFVQGNNAMQWKRFAPGPSQQRGISHSYIDPRPGQPPVPDTQEEFERQMRAIGMYWYDLNRWDDLNWSYAPDAWIEVAWSRFGEHLLKKTRSFRGHLPVYRAGKVEIIQARHWMTMKPRFEDIIPPTRNGWELFLAKAHTSELAASVLSTAGRWWWSRGTPAGVAEEPKTIPNKATL